MARGQPVTLRAKRGFQICVVIAVAPFPFLDSDAFMKFSEDAVVIFRKPMNEGIHPCDIRLVDGDLLQTWGSLLQPPCALYRAPYPLTAPPASPATSLRSIR